jgi:hypothetical protein
VHHLTLPDGYVPPRPLPSGNLLTCRGVVIGAGLAPHHAPTAFRACELCIHRVARDGQLLCGRAAGQMAGPPEPLHVARSDAGACGPGARHLDMASWRE